MNERRKWPFFIGKFVDDVTPQESTNHKFDLGKIIGELVIYVSEGGPKSEMAKRQKEFDLIIEEYNYIIYYNCFQF